MKKQYWFALAGALGVTAISPSFSQAAGILSPNDFIIAIDSDPNIALSLSNHPAGEAAIKAIDGAAGTKYLNFGKLNTGLIVTPGMANTTINGIRFSTANDDARRDPTSWVLEGSTASYTEAELATANNNNGSFGTWTPIASGNVAMPAERLTQMEPIAVANTTAYNSYRIYFPTIKDNAANSMQIGEVTLLQNGNTIFDEFGGDRASAFHLAPIVPDSRYNAGEGPRYLLDGSGPNPTILQSRYPTVPPNANYEGPNNLVDGNTATKYLNFGKVDSGFIIQPSGGASQVRSFTLTTANDAVGRDPSGWQLFGTNAPITSLDNGYGTAEAWTPIDSGTLALPAERLTLGPVVTVNNPSSYTAYKMLFTSVIDAVPAVDSMQIAEAAFFSSTDGTGANLLTAPTTILAVDGTITTGLQSKYFNFGKNNSGIIVTPAAGAKVVTSMQLTTTNDFPQRDPASFEIYGTNASIVSEEHSQGTDEAWTLIASGDLALPEERFTAGDVVTFANATAYASYKIVFPTVKDDPVANGMQIGGLQLFDNATASNADFDGNGVVDGADFLTWQRNLGATGQTNNQNGDANGDGAVTAADLAIWKDKFGGPGATAAVGSVPEPASFAMLGLGLLAGGTLVRGSRRS